MSYDGLEKKLDNFVIHLCYTAHSLYMLCVTLALLSPSFVLVRVIHGWHCLRICWYQRYG